MNLLRQLRVALDKSASCVIMEQYYIMISILDQAIAGESGVAMHREGNE